MFRLDPWAIQLNDQLIDNKKADLSVQLENDLKFQLEKMTIENLNEDFKLMRVESCVSQGTLALLLHSVRERSFRKGHFTLALPLEIAPFQICFFVSPSKDPKLMCQLIELRDFLVDLSQKEEISVKKDVGDFNAADDYGIPFCVVLSEHTLKNGIVHLRDRESSWFEQIHVAYLTQRLTKVFQGRFIDDSWTNMKKTLKMK